ncbi:chemotaxis-specific protein-glutamate methyltransferase CheB [Roseomonas sp. OT10]|uniref:chemotaxis-specific protein-glutamate methyltransferase CheB n=1 Tax=Roseomonas cutis TaxID=2897332 RepID=UPI001E5A0CE4|nr:chemotaxis-specific protein-glutamate methyltransferase CheB [Roseomonas sp. OT10]UFN51136.1 chemotaxis-specific protein-glutamate methyltransferase CheB [Roseomonas sp. OT10]
MTGALPPAEGPVRVMLCDDSLTARAALSRMLEADAGIRVVARAGDGRAALAAFAAMPAAQRPEVVLLDLEMPVMDGMTVLPLLLACTPRPAVIVASALTRRGAAIAMEALRAGASDVLPKPDAASGGGAFQAELVEKVRGWGRMLRGRADRAAARPATAAESRPAAPDLPRQAPRRAARVLAIGSSTGGPQALAALLRALAPAPPPVPILVVQHMPAGFTAMLADHLSRVGALPVAEAVDGSPLRPGRVFLAPGDHHLLVEAGPEELVARVTRDPAENFCRPSVDPMLRSLARATAGAAVATILTGMGSDGLSGCRALVSAGGRVLAQDEASSVVWGMPGAVARAGLAEALLPPDALAARLMAGPWDASTGASPVRRGTGPAPLLAAGA